MAKKRGRKHGQKQLVAPLLPDRATAAALQVERRHQDRVLADRAKYARIIRDRGIVNYLAFQLHNNRDQRISTKVICPDAAKLFGVSESYVRDVWKKRNLIRRRFRESPVKLLHG
jgi:hypothetical protein